MKTFLACAALAAASLATSPAAAQSCQSCQSCNGGANYAGGSVGGVGWSKGVKYEDSIHRNLMWPNQYIQPSRRGICSAFATMADNGWRRNNLLGEYHFEGKDRQELSEAGRRKAAWVLTQAPSNRRTIYVERAGNVDGTAERVAAVQDYAANMSPSAAVDVQETHLRNEGHPAGAVDAVFTGFSANQLPPVLPQASSGDSADSGS